MVMKKVIIELWMPEDEDVNDKSVGRALGEALMTGTLTYETVPYIVLEGDE
jgi:hypothetical protein